MLNSSFFYIITQRKESSSVVPLLMDWHVNIPKKQTNKQKNTEKPPWMCHCGFLMFNTPNLDKLQDFERSLSLTHSPCWISGKHLSPPSLTKVHRCPSWFLFTCCTSCLSLSCFDTKGVYLSPHLFDLPHERLLCCVLCIVLLSVSLLPHLLDFWIWEFSCDNLHSVGKFTAKLAVTLLSCHTTISFSF